MIPIVRSDTDVALVERQGARRRSAGASASLALLFVTLAAVLAGRGGTAGAQSPARATVTIDAGSRAGAISPLLHGQFLEFMYEGIKGGLTAELLRDRGFEAGAQRHRPVARLGAVPGRPQRRLRAETSTGTTRSRIRWRTDYFEKPPVQHALRVDAGGGIVERHGIYQPRSRSGRDRLRWLSLAEDDRLRRAHRGVALEEDVSGGDGYAEAEIGEVSGDWEQYPFALRPGGPTRTPGSPSSSRERGAVGRPGVAPARRRRAAACGPTCEARVARRCAPAFLRWPGGNVAQDYHWTWGVGPRDRRPDLGRTCPGRTSRSPATSAPTSSSRSAAASAPSRSLTVNVEGRGATAEEAAAWVEYCNGPATSRYGAMRAAQRSSGAVRREVLGDRQRDLGRLGARPFRRRRPTPATTCATTTPCARWTRRSSLSPSATTTWTGTAPSLPERRRAPSTTSPSTTTTARKAMAGDARNLMARPLLLRAVLQGGRRS